MARNALLGMAQMPTLQYRPETQVESLGKATQAVGGLQSIQMRQMEMEKAKQDAAMLQQFRQTMMQAGKNPDPSVYGQALIQTGRPELVAKGSEIMRAVQSEAALKQELGGYQNRLAQGDARGVAQSMAVSPTPGMAQRAQALTRTLPPEPKGYAPTELERLNAALAKLPPGSPERKVYEARIAKLTEPSKGVTVEMPVAVYDPDTKTVKYVPRAEAVGKAPASAAPKPAEAPSVSETQAATATARLLQRAKEISAALENTPQAEAPSAVEAGLLTLPGLSAAANLVRSTDRQIVASAQDDVLDALLYLATGAAYNKEQLQQQKSAYLASWSDDPRTRSVKRQRLVDMIGNAKIRAGKAWTPELDAQLNLLLDSPAMKPAAPAQRGAVGGEAAPKRREIAPGVFVTERP